MKSFLSLLLWPLFFSLSALNAQEKDFSINGFIKDAITGEELVGTNILLYKDSVSTQNPPLTGTASNRFGYYVIPSLSTGKYFLII
ncbi:carboxypeptidase-like regulatory domain-containing protein, partial [bacterium BMS3Abin03]|nr:carboxypeptidase-like regulatory domain-containing protein [bacterium BMS3Abin03]